MLKDNISLWETELIEINNGEGSEEDIDDEKKVENED